jgi:hypothetical protein
MVRWEENALPVVVLGVLCDFLFCFLLPTATSSRRLLDLYPDVARLLAVVALRKTILNSICLCPDCDVAEAWQSENFLEFFCPWQGY